MKIWDAITNKYREVEISTNEYGSFYTENGERLYRIETKGKTGAKMYINVSEYLTLSGNQKSVSGMGGATGHGWGGRVCGFITKEEADKLNITTKVLF